MGYGQKLDNGTGTNGRVDGFAFNGIDLMTAYRRPV